MSSEYGGGAKVIELKRDGMQTTATELWASTGCGCITATPCASATRSISRAAGRAARRSCRAVDARSGTIHWQQRSIEKATFVWADKKLITLDQDGNLMIAYPSPQGFKIAAKAPLMTRLSWTPPVLVGTRLYLRDRGTMMAVDLG